ncbi:pilus assembly protein PilP [Nitrospirales bacterium NOB]|nr:MAG: putative type IV pilus assembly protein PilP [Nitrospira sp. OLB3]MBV6469646.1 hypothetical protein [Nitrospirota bacterium]MCE7965512.1 hypothetical protein [Nitrospira sp. NTP2]MDL1888245.1 pilus assembly protein PilP [Nitrospirales bacterium NOB]MEB2338759.1 pilus assembly protein PilP [Nitrospirales bacterium]RIK58800.1 MAG: hypothetical protein DCC63_09525 [Nitrospira sp.]
MRNLMNRIDSMSVRRRRMMKTAVVCAMALLIGGVVVQPAESKSLPHLRQIASLRPADTLKVAPLPQERKTISPGEGSISKLESAIHESENSLASEFLGASYDPSGRRDPFLPLYQLGQQTEADATLPPLQRVGLTELSLIAVIWGNYGYTAMVQTPDGKGYSIRRGTRIGPNNGVVSSITERGIIVQERFMDVYGNKQEREYVKLLHPKEGTE